MSLLKLFIGRPEEKIVFALRRHPIVFLGPIFVFVLLLAVPFALRAFLIGPIHEIENPLLQVGALLLLSMYYLGIWVFFFSEFTDYYLDVTIVTGDRIIDVNQKGLFGRAISELDLTRVQDVKSVVKGIIPTLFNYGEVTVETAATEENFVMEQIPNPHHIRQRIIEMAAFDRKREARDIATVASPGEAAAEMNDMQRQGLG
jgi:uncharacterized membrane protein YdbT with pleckstrin-like domain